MKFQNQFPIFLFIVLFIGSCGTTQFNRQKFTELKKIQTEGVEAISENLSKTQNLSKNAEPEAAERPIILEPARLKKTEMNEATFENIISKVELVDCGDTLILINGETIEAEILEVTEYGVVYRKCSNINGPKYTKAKSEVNKVVYENGKTELITERRETENANNNYGNKPIEPFAIASWVFVLVFFLSFVGIGFSITSLIILRNNPREYDPSSKWWAIGSLILNSIIFAWMGYIIFLF